LRPGGQRRQTGCQHECEYGFFHSIFTFPAAGANLDAPLKRPFVLKADGKPFDFFVSIVGSVFHLSENNKHPQC
jgi:hypothetical protein